MTTEILIAVACVAVGALIVWVIAVVRSDLRSTYRPTYRRKRRGGAGRGGR